MRFLVKIPVPNSSENPLAGDPAFEQRLRELFRRIGALAHYSNLQDGRRLEYVLVDIDPGQITPTAEQVVHLLGMKPEFLPEVAPQPYYGRIGY